MREFNPMNEGWYVRTGRAPIIRRLDDPDIYETDIPVQDKRIDRSSNNEKVGETVNSSDNRSQQESDKNS